MLVGDRTESLVTGIEYREAIVGIASEFVGALSMRYVRGRPDLGMSPETGFDCSGFVRFVLTEAGLSIPDYIGQDNDRRPIRHANEFWDYYGVAIHEPLHRAGDLIFFSRNGDFPSHIGIVRDEESYIHARGSDKTQVRVDAIKSEVISVRQAVCRQFYAKNPIGFKSPAIAKLHPDYRYHQTII
jgi:cell wall-associated NlpC family hydrolase